MYIFTPKSRLVRNRYFWALTFSFSKQIMLIFPNCSSNVIMTALENIFHLPPTNEQFQLWVAVAQITQEMLIRKRSNCHKNLLSVIKIMLFFPLFFLFSFFEISLASVFLGFHVNFMILTSQHRLKLKKLQQKTTPTKKSLKILLSIYDLSDIHTKKQRQTRACINKG